MKHTTAVLCLACAIGGAALTWPIVASAQNKPGEGGKNYTVISVTRQMGFPTGLQMKLDEMHDDRWEYVEMIESTNNGKQIVFRKRGR